VGLHLVTVRSLRERAFLADLQVVNAGLTAVLSGLTEQLEAELRTPFGAVAGQVDLFYVERPARFHGRDETRLLLSRGFVDESTTALSVLVASRAVTFTPGNLGEDPTDLRNPPFADDPEQFVKIDAERGLVILHDVVPAASYVQVTYDAGIAVDPDAPAQFLQSAVPGWLKELATADALIEVASTKQFGEVGKDPRSGKVRAADTTALERKFDRLLRAHVRYVPDALRPL
jgi:hypothetical protein